MRILLPVDGSPHSDRATQHVVTMLQGRGHDAVLLLNVQEPIDAPEVRGHMRAEEIEAMQISRGGDAIASARALLDKAGFAYTPSIVIGPIALTISNFAADQGCDMIVMGTRGLGAISSVLMGSVTTELLHLTELPVTLVK